MQTKMEKELFNKEVQEAIARLVRDKDFKVFTDFIEACRDNKALLSCVIAEDIRTRWMQGEVKFADYLLTVVETAPAMVRNT